MFPRCISTSKLVEKTQRFSLDNNPLMCKCVNYGINSFLLLHNNGTLQVLQNNNNKCSRICIHGGNPACIVGKRISPMVGSADKRASCSHLTVSLPPPHHTLLLPSPIITVGIIIFWWSRIPVAYTHIKWMLTLIRACFEPAPVLL